MSNSLCATYKNEETKSFLPMGENISGVLNFAAAKFPPLSFFKVSGEEQNSTYTICGPLFGILKEFSIFQKIG